MPQKEDIRLCIYQLGIMIYETKPPILHQGLIDKDESIIQIEHDILDCVR